MNLTGEQFEQLHNALLSAFPNAASLKHMIRTKLNENLEKVAGGDNLSAMVHDLLEWGEAQGRLEELIEKAYKTNPGNSNLKLIAEALLITHPSLGSHPKARVDLILAISSVLGMAQYADDSSVKEVKKLEIINQGLEAARSLDHISDELLAESSVIKKYYYMMSAYQMAAMYAPTSSITDWEYKITWIDHSVNSGNIALTRLTDYLKRDISPGDISGKEQRDLFEKGFWRELIFLDRAIVLSTKAKHYHEVGEMTVDILRFICHSVSQLPSIFLAGNPLSTFPDLVWVLEQTDNCSDGT